MASPHHPWKVEYSSNRRGVGNFCWRSGQFLPVKKLQTGKICPAQPLAPICLHVRYARAPRAKWRIKNLQLELPDMCFGEHG